jgi:hypothetical protein
MRVNANGRCNGMPPSSGGSSSGIVMGMEEFYAQERLPLHPLNCSGKMTGSSVNSLGANRSAGCRRPMPANCRWRGSSRPERRQKTPSPLWKQHFADNPLGSDLDRFCH